MKLRQLAVALACACSGTNAFAAPVFVNGITLPAPTQDLSQDIALNTRLGMFSDIHYDPTRNEWWALGDRGPGGGTLSYDTRVQQFKIDINPVTGFISNFKVMQTIKFTDSTGTLPFNGLAPSPTNVLGRAFDPEGFVVRPKTGTFLVSDEYGPSLNEFDRSGKFLRAFTTPANLIPRSGGIVNFAGGDPEPNTQGRRTNRGFEGLAVTPDGKYSYAMLQSAMLDDGGGNSAIVRIVKFDNATGQAVFQYAYQMASSGQGRGISALVALNDTEFLVLERNNRGVGVPDANLASPVKDVFKINLTGAATDVTGIDLDDPAAVFTPVSKSPSFINLAANTLPDFGINRVAEKWEGLAIGPQLADGEYVILAGTDNDFSVSQVAGSTTQFNVYYKPSNSPATARIQCTMDDINPFSSCVVIAANGSLGGAFTGDPTGFELIPGLLYAYKSTAGDFATFVAATPEPGTWTMLLAGLGLLGFAMRRRG